MPLTKATKGVTPTVWQAHATPQAWNQTLQRCECTMLIFYVLQVLQCNSNSIGPTSKFKWLKWAHIEVAANKSTQTAKQFIMEEVCSVSPALHYHTGTCTQTQTHTHPHTLLTVSNLLWSGPLECSNSCRLNVTEESTLAVIYEPSKGLHSNLTNTWNNLKFVTGDHNSLAGTHGWSSHASPGKPGCLRWS